MYCKIKEKEIEDIETTNIVQQTSFWARVKYKQGFIPCAFEYKASGDILYPSADSTEYSLY